MKLNRMFFLLCLVSFLKAAHEYDFVTIAILAKDKAEVLPLYLKCIEQQTWPKEKIYLYIRTNNNNDNTVDILKSWINKVQDQYADVYFDDSDVDVNIQQYAPHEWNSIRFKVLGEIRQKSIDWAYAYKSHYFVVDCDNFIKPDTLECMIQDNISIIAPLLVTESRYSNFHASVDSNGYCRDCSLYNEILYQVKKGLIEVPVVHCTYFIRNEYLPYMSYDDGSCRYEYVIFSDNARKSGISQCVDNMQIYGYVTFATKLEELQHEYWYNTVLNW